MNDHPFHIQLGRYEQEFEVYGAYQVLLRALIESKFSEASFDTLILQSRTLADLSRDLVTHMDELGVKLGMKPPGAQRTWLTVTGRNDRAYAVMLRKLQLPTAMNQDISAYLRHAEPAAQLAFLAVVFAPYAIEDPAARCFLSDLGG